MGAGAVHVSHQYAATSAARGKALRHRRRGRLRNRRYRFAGDGFVRQRRRLDQRLVHCHIVVRRHGRSRGHRLGQFRARKRRRPDSRTCQRERRQRRRRLGGFDLDGRLGNRRLGLFHLPGDRRFLNRRVVLTTPRLRRQQRQGKEKTQDRQIGPRWASALPRHRRLVLLARAPQSVREPGRLGPGVPSKNTTALHRVHPERTQNPAQTSSLVRSAHLASNPWTEGIEPADFAAHTAGGGRAVVNFADQQKFGGRWPTASGDSMQRHTPSPLPLPPPKKKCPARAPAKNPPPTAPSRC